MSQALYRKWRSQSFDELVGQEHIKQTLQNALRDDRVAHAYLFAGPRGTGKTSMARILAKALNCSAPVAERPCGACPTCVAISEGRMIDLIEIDAASNNSVDDVRELRDKVSFRPSEGRYKIYIIDEVHMLSTNAFNALLKTLEEPPPHARFILATTESHKIPATILSRCQRFDFRRIPVGEIATHLRHIVEAEGGQAEDDALFAIARSAQGGMRDAISLLDQMLSSGATQVSLEQVQQMLGVVGAEAVMGLVESMAKKDVAAGLRLIHQLVLAGASLTELCQQVVEHLRGLMVLLMARDPSLLTDVPAETLRQMQEQAQRLTLPEVLFAVKRFGEAGQQLKGGMQPQLPLELALIEAIQGGMIQPVPAAAVGENASGSTAAAPVRAVEAAPVAVTAQAGPPTAAAEPQGAPSPLDHAALDRLRRRWKELKADIRTHCGIQVEAAINTVRDMAVSGQTVALAFGNNTFTRDLIAKPETLRKVATVFSDFLGTSVQIECQMGEQAKLANAIDAVVTDDITDGTDPLVEYAINDLGAKVID
jgi:DNA polymerase III subunit gamma/tau